MGYSCLYQLEWMDMRAGLNMGHQRGGGVGKKAFVFTIFALLLAEPITTQQRQKREYRRRLQHYSVSSHITGEISEYQYT